MGQQVHLFFYIKYVHLPGTDMQPGLGLRVSRNIGIPI